MKLNFSSLINLVAVTCAVPALACASISTLNPDQRQIAKKLDANHTLLIVDASGCGWCTRFLPEATKVSDQDTAAYSHK